MLVGDIIIPARALMTDMPRTIPGPAGLTVAVVAAPGSTLPVGIYTVQCTFVNNWGETLGSNIVNLVNIGPNQGIQVTAPTFATNPTATGIRVYYALTGQPFSQFIQSSVIPFTISSLGLPGTVPTRNTSFYPDSDGAFVSAYTLYDWLNDALTTASLICKGIPDVSGIQMLSGQGFYTMPGIWDKLESCWYDGFPVAFDARSGAFYRNVLSGITFIGILQTSSDRQILELQPQPSRQGGTTTLSAPLGIADTAISITDTSQIGLPLGMLLIGTEVISYGTLSGNQAIGCSRGLGGTQQSAWPAGTAVTELNFRFGGLRLSQQVRYKPGDSLITLQVPPGWKQPLVYYLGSRFSDAENDMDGGEKSLKRFVSFLKEYNLGTKQTAGPRQVGGATTAGDGYPTASSGGRVIIP